MSLDQILAKRKRSGNATGFKGVSKTGVKFKAIISFRRTSIYLGTFDTAIEASIAFRNAQSLIKKGLFDPPPPVPKEARQPKLANNKRPRKNLTGYRGVTKSSPTLWKATITVKGTVHFLGSFRNPKGAALAYDNAIVKYDRPRNNLNFPNGIAKDDPDYLALTNPTHTRRYVG
jgi:hypothetical protein|tara:strand:+ start:28 stop:549 length:522 start_codon:yes stop_codon:yes gene_type:complete